MKKILFGFSVLLFSGIFSHTFAVEYENFPETKCKSVHVIYLESSDEEKPEYKLFEVLENIDDQWNLVPSEKDRAKKSGFSTDGSIRSSQVLQRFRFGTGVYKKYCIDFQESVPVGPQGENANSIGADSGLDLVKQYVSMVYKFGSMFIGLVCVLVIVVSGVQMTMGGVSEESFSKGKERIMASLASLILLFASAMILRTINPGFFT